MIKPEFSEEIIEAFAEAWASIDGKLGLFLEGKKNSSVVDEYGHYGGYLAEAEELLIRAKIRIKSIDLEERLK